jgi:MSHA biogenesis protein MshG
MPLFAYSARGGNGQLIDGELEGSNSSAVAGMLMERGVTPITIVEKKVRANHIEAISRRLRLQRISIEELLMFTRQMGALIRAGIPITRAISGILESVQNPLLIDALRDVLDQLESGRSLSVACARHPRVFSNLYVSMIQVGENTGKLDDSFRMLADYIDRSRRTTQNIKTALRYPTTVIIAISVAMVILNLFVIPKFASFFQANQLELPWQTIFLLNTSKFFVDYWMLLFGVLLALVFGFRSYVNTVDGRYQWHRFILRTPLVGDILHRAFMARFARSFAMAYGAGVPIVLAMGVIARSIGNDFIAAHVGGMREGIERGEALSRTARATGMFTPVVMQMFAVGEETGKLDEMMSYIADFYEEEVDYDVKTLSDRIEPLIYVAIGAMVLILALGIFVPLWDVAQLAGR